MITKREKTPEEFETIGSQVFFEKRIQTLKDFILTSAHGTLRELAKGTIEINEKLLALVVEQRARDEMLNLRKG